MAPPRRSGPVGGSSGVAKIADQARISAVGTQLLAKGAAKISSIVFMSLRMTKDGR